MPFVELALGRPKRDLGVDRRAPADAAPADQRHRAEAEIARREREAQRPPVVVRGPALPPHEIGRHVVPAGLEQQHRPAALGEVAGDDAATRARTNNDHLEALAHATPMLTRPPCSRDPRCSRRHHGHATPRYDQSFLILIASGEWKSISSYALGPARARGDEVAVERLDRECPDQCERRRRRVRFQRVGAAGCSVGKRVDRPRPPPRASGSGIRT